MRNNRAVNELPVAGQAALDYLGRGFSVIPINPENKKALIAWKEYQKRQPTKDEVFEWWQNTPDAMVGIITGEVSNLCVIDADNKRALKTFIEECDDDVYAEIPMVKTPSEDSYHFYFQNADGLSVASKIQAMGGCDIRCEGGYVIAPPSVNSADGKYQWIRTHNIEEKAPQPMPQEMNDTLLVATTARVSTVPMEQTARSAASEGETFRDGDQWVFDGIVPQGIRDDTMFHLAYRLKNGGMPDEEIESFLILFSNELCEHNEDDPDPRDKVASVVARSNQVQRNIGDEVRAYLLDEIVSGEFTYSQVYTDLGIMTPEEKNTTRKVVSRMVKPDGGGKAIVEKVEGKQRTFAFVDDEIDFMDFANEDTSASNIWLPFGLDNIMNVYAGNVLVVAGEPNAGKTALMLNIVKENLDKFKKVRYLNSEMGAAELRSRLEKFDNWPKEEWKFEAVNRASNFERVLKKGEGNLNVIDFMEIVDNFYEINKFLIRIHNKLEGAIAVIAIQKDFKTELGRGSSFGLEKPKLYMTMGYSAQSGMGNACIIKCKDWSKVNENPNGKIVGFHLVNGSKFICDNDWRMPPKEDE